MKKPSSNSDERDARHLSHTLKRHEICHVFRAGVREPAGPTQRAGPFHPETVLRTDMYHLQTDWLGRPVLTNGKRPKMTQIARAN